jgi:hypothetical protein
VCIASWGVDLMAMQRRCFSLLLHDILSQPNNLWLPLHSLYTYSLERPSLALLLDLNGGKIVQISDDVTQTGPKVVELMFCNCLLRYFVCYHMNWATTFICAAAGPQVQGCCHLTR